MKKLQTSDLTPALLQEVLKLSAAKEVVAFFASKDLEVSEEGAQKILDHLKKEAVPLADDDLDRLIKTALADAQVTTYKVEGALNVSPRLGKAGKGLVLCETGCAPAGLQIGRPMTDLLTGLTFRDTVPVEPYGVRVLKEITI